MTLADSDTSTSAAHTPELPEAGLSSRSFVGLLLTQLLSATNDNVFRWLAIGIGKDYVDREQVAFVLTAGTACFVAPYLLLAAVAGYLADRFSKRSVVVACKLAEICIMAVGMLAIYAGSQYGLFAVVALMGAQSALFSPSKLGLIPEILPANKISAANGLFGLATVGATVGGAVIGSKLSDITGERGLENTWLSAVTLIGIAVVGYAVSRLIRPTNPQNPKKKFPWDSVSQTWRDLRVLRSHRALFRVALGSVFFWSIGGLAQMNIDQFAFEGGGVGETAKTPLLICLILGVGIGSVLAGVWSAGRVELGILPLGAGGVAISAMLLFTVRGEIFTPQHDVGVTVWLIYACVLLLGLGISAGLFSVPLDAFLQHRSPPEQRGSILAAGNFLTFTGILFASLLFAGLRYPSFDGGYERLPDRLRLETTPNAALDSELLNIAEEAATARGDRDKESALAASRRIWKRFLVRHDEEKADKLIARGLWLDLESLSSTSSESASDLEFAGRHPYSNPVSDLEFAERHPYQAEIARRVHLSYGRQPLASSRTIFLLSGLATIPVFLYIIMLIPQASIRFIVWLASHTVYRIQVNGLENLPKTGGALLVANHVSWLDGVLLLLASSRPVRMIGDGAHVNGRFSNWIANLWGVIRMTKNPKQISLALKEAQQALDAGELVCIFPEGGVSRTGQLQGFRRGMSKILEGTKAEIPVVPVFLHGLWGSIFSFEGGKFFWKWPKRWPYPVQIHLGKPVANDQDTHAVRRAVQDLGAQAVLEQSDTESTIIADFIRSCRQRRRTAKITDTTGQSWTGGELLLRSLILRRLLKRKLKSLSDDERHVGVLLPPTAGAVAVNAALTLDNQIAVNLNYTASPDALNQCIELAGIRHVITSRRFLEKMPFELDADFVYLEDLRETVTTTDKLASWLGANLLPAGILLRQLGVSKILMSDVMTVIFTSGSTGVPKGVELTFGNIASNTNAVDQIVHLRPEDVVIGILPFFHSFGFTVTLWTVLVHNVQGAYHTSPLEAKQVGKLCRKTKATILLATPTFLRSYLKRCEKEQLASLDVVVVGAEKMPLELADSFEEKFGVRPTEGYGTTELSPLVSVNVPPSRSVTSHQVDAREGSVGRPISGVSTKILDVDTGEEKSANEDGLLWIAGPNVMKGYLKRQDLTAEVIRDGWYNTGDIAHVDEDGFIHITGRQSRFSKIGGEMVPHIRIEEELARLLGGDELMAVVTAVPDERKGEKLAVLHLPVDRTPQELNEGLLAAGLPNLYIPTPDAYIEVEEIPVLGTGKLDLKGMQKTACERLA
jgi:acyl-[acyl-carrier-protein]-phospholipid O-acyltransferase / long-chain-fatty-acid--[acyl-carrier-protein] ligase